MAGKNLIDGIYVEGKVRAKSLEGKGGTESKQKDVFAKVDNCIIAVCDKIQKEDCAPGEYANTVKALAELVSARVSIFQDFSVLSVLPVKALNVVK